MERIYIIGNNENNVKHLGFSYVIVPSLINDEEIDRWTISFIKDNQVDKLIIDLSDNSILFLKIALHIRLSLEELEKKALIPLLFISVSSLTNILAVSGSWSHILTTKGAYFSSYEHVKTEVQYVEYLKAEEFKMNFLNIINILPDEKTGRHSLANIWGAYVMDKTANTNALIGNDDFRKNRTKLYFKYVKALNYDLPKFNQIIEYHSLGEQNNIDASNRKILFIDDEADKGWETVLRKVFKTSLSDDFVVINKKIENYDNLSTENKSLIETKPFDLYLVDLRLYGPEEENTLQPDDFSGMKVLRKIKSLNQGNQVIMFTASNKVWNLKALLDAGADGYYMKESPEFSFSDEFSKQNYARFQTDVKNCFERKYLTTIWECCKAIDNHFLKKKPLKKFFPNNLELLKALGYQNLIIAELESIFSILETTNENRLNISMLSLFKILECISEIFIPISEDDRINMQKDMLKFWDGSDVDCWKFDSTTKSYIPFHYPFPKTESIKLEAYKSTENKIRAILYQKLSLKCYNLHHSIHSLVQYRNDYIHPRNRFKLKELKSDEITSWFNSIRQIIEKI